MVQERCLNDQGVIVQSLEHMSVMKDFNLHLDFYLLLSYIVDKHFSHS